MSPEQARGSMAEVDELSDIYALGGILYAILTLRPPVEGKTALEVLEKVSRGEITSPTALKTSSGSRGKVFEKGEVLEAKQIKPLPHLRGGLVPSALSSVAMKALRLDKSERFASVTALSADIDAYLTGFATSSEQAGVLRQLQLLMLRHKVVTASLAALLVVSLGFMVNLRTKERRAVAGEARSVIGLADAALRNGNGVRMQELLHTVPAEMRDSSWHYLLGQSDTSVTTIQLNPPKAFSLAPLPRTPGGLAVAQSGGGISFIHARSGKLLKEFAAGISTSWAIPRIAVSPDGERIAIGQWDGPGGIVVRNIRSGQEILRWDAPETKSLMFNADGSLLLQRCRPVNNNPASIRIWDSATGALLWQEGPPGAIFATFSPDGRQVIVSNTSSGLRIVDARDGQTIRRLPGEYHNVIDLAACREGLLAALDNRAEVIVFDLHDDTVLTRFAGPGPRSRDHFIGWTPDRAVLITAWQSADSLQVVQLRNPRNGAVIRSLLGGRQGISSAAVHPLTGELAIGLSGLKVWDVRDTPTLLKYPSHPTPFLGFLGTDDTLVSYANPQSAPIVNRGTKTLWTLKNSGYRFLSTSPSGAVAAIHTGDSRQPVLILEREGDSVRQTRAITTQCQDHLVRLNPTGNELAIFRDKVERFTLAGEPLPALEQGRIVQFNDIAWLPATGRMIGLVTMHGLRFSKDSEEHIVLWDAASGKQQRSIPHPTRMNFLAVMPDGRQFAEAGADAMVRLRDADTLAVVHEFRAHDGPITALACHPTRRILATGSQDLCVRLWDADNGQLLEELRGPIQPPTQLIFSPSGRQLACSVANDECRLWKPTTLNQAIKDSRIGTTE
ncbi:hypothetical protein [Prosthecobacter sp.]|uniref:hypothetical protein n=1 Tax=Prosthecobacter sp. TaxID=1965333 RepID=UPI002ABCA21F|nr:hypothetical protein [Prosthecobacter sp.]MDZ4405320.1 hypothetical protein [Prosthecobacter sp.]